MTVILNDPDVTVHHGDVFDILPTLEPGSFDCVITSPPYWGQRDYGTGSWDGGDPDCDHQRPMHPQRYFNGRGEDHGRGGTGSAERGLQQYADTCGKCGAQRVDNQLGLEATPDQYIARMVDVFRMVRRVLAPHGTVWLNLGDSYGSGTSADRNPTSTSGPDVPASWSNRSQPQRNGLKPKDLVGIPWRLALALQADGWYLRADIIWAKPNPMPESVTDRPTKAHEYVFLLTKRPRYWFDQEAVREPWSEKWTDSHYRYMTGNVDARSNRVTGRGGGPGIQGYVAPGVVEGSPDARGRNVRDVWTIATQPYAEAHFATFPEELVRRCLLAGCPEWVCRVCGKPRERIVEVGELVSDEPGYRPRGIDKGGMVKFNPAPNHHRERRDLGWSDCGHGDYRPGLVLDPFLGSGTTAHVARKHGRHAVGVELSADYCRLIARRLQQLSLLA